MTIQRHLRLHRHRVIGNIRITHLNRIAFDGQFMVNAVLAILDANTDRPVAQIDNAFGGIDKEFIARRICRQSKRIFAEQVFVFCTVKHLLQHDLGIRAAVCNRNTRCRLATAAIFPIGLQLSRSIRIQAQSRRRIISSERHHLGRFRYRNGRIYRLNNRPTFETLVGTIRHPQICRNEGLAKFELTRRRCIRREEELVFVSGVDIHVISHIERTRDHVLDLEIHLIVIRCSRNHIFRLDN